MTTAYVGANPDQLDALGLSLEDGADRFEQLRSTLGMGLYDGSWAGPDADSARADWDTLYSPALAAASEVLATIGTLARSNALAQREASAGELFFQNGGDLTGWPPAGYPGDGDPAALRQYWLNIALANAGIDISLWDPSLGAVNQQEIIEEVYTYYANLYLENPYMMWAGMAAMVGPSFAAGFLDMPMFQGIAQYAADEFSRVPVIGGIFESMANAGHEDLVFYEATFLQMQQDIFVDQAVMHEAYLSGGMTAVQDLYDAGLIDADTLAAWWQIDNGVATGDQGLIEQGNEQLLYREQHDIIQVYYDQMFHHEPSGQAFTYMLGIIGDPAVPGALTYGDYQPLHITSEVVTDINIPFLPEPPIPDLFVRTPFPDGNLANFDDRWEYISGDTLVAFQALTTTQVSDILSVPVEQRIADYRIGMRYEAIIADLQNDWGGGITIENGQ